jgi:hypothetical protein
VGADVEDEQEQTLTNIAAKTRVAIKRLIEGCSIYACDLHHGGEAASPPARVDKAVTKSTFPTVVDPAE